MRIDIPTMVFMNRPFFKIEPLLEASFSPSAWEFVLKVYKEIFANIFKMRFKLSPVFLIILVALYNLTYSLQATTHDITIDAELGTFLNQSFTDVSDFANQFIFLNKV